MRIHKIALLLMAAVSLASANAPRARDWFVRAGSEGGDGSAAKPFSDPWQALEKCEAGDAIHVTGGKYYGKLNGGMWEIPFDNIQLLGGYDKEFKERDPWTNRSELLWDKNSKNRPNDSRLIGKAKNAVVDGFCVDMQDANKYGDPERTGRTDVAMETAFRDRKSVV